MTDKVCADAIRSSIALEVVVTEPDRTTPILLDIDDRSVARVVLNRPERNNAYDGDLIQALLAALDTLEQRSGLRAVVISGRGRHFQAGADLTWIDAIRTASAEDNIRASRATAQAVWRLNRAPVPTIALVQGACFGGGTGLLAACDVAIAADDAVFSIAEVRWGLTAAIIIPQLNDAIGVRQVRRYALTGERFGAAEARRIGLVHEIVPASELEAAGARIVEAVLQNGPQAIAQTKAHALERAWAHLDEADFSRLVESHAAKRQSAEAAEGLASFAEKRAARWR
jgi:methylglutaconyl-CoA hydratase